METKILNFNNQEDIDYIHNNSIFKKDFENLCNRYSSDSMDIFIKRPKYINGIFAIAILDNHIISMAKGEERKEYLYITNVFTSELHRSKGGCKAVIKSMLRNWYSYTSNGFINDLSVMLSVTFDNMSAINCYKYFGFTDVINSETIVKNFFGKEERFFKMILTKEAYIEKYLLPLYENKLKEKNQFF
jgi:predicted GNAT family acetyltransferase